MDDAKVVGRFERAFDQRWPRSSSVWASFVRIRIEAEDLAQVRLAGLGQLQPVGFGRGVRLLVRIDVPFAKALQAARGP